MGFPGIDQSTLRAIRRAWDLYGCQRAVATAAGVSRQTAAKYKPGIVPASAPVQRGYATWSEPARRRWDAFWSDPTGLDRLSELLSGGERR